MSFVERALEKLRRAGTTIESVPRRPSAPPPVVEAELPHEPIGALSPVSAEHVAESEQLPRILIDRGALRSAGYLPETQQDRRFADEYRHIKRPLIAAAHGPAAADVSSPRLIMMASALPGDGKTFTSINLALSMARERDTTVVLVDADVAKPHISRIFGVDKELGLLDALADHSLDVNALVLPTDVKGLSILPAGRPRDNATELVASVQMRDVLRRIIAARANRVALFDSSPLLVSSESRALASFVGQVALVVRAGRTPRQAVLDAIGHLGEGKSIGLVLNQGRASFSEGLYGFGYGYGSKAYYGNYGDSHEDGAAH
jgi:exopolysaccharide/PEP-CTERM locus tyrosine autokinase